MKLKKSISLILALAMILTIAIVVPATASAALAAPKVTKIKSVSAGVSLTWGAVKGAAKYRVFIKSSSKWKKVADTAKTSYIYKSVNSGKKYTFTVRCLSENSKKYTSAYDKKGWSITYKKPVNWKKLYKSYVKSHMNSMPWGNKTFNINSSTEFKLHDMDMNGVPELIVSSSISYKSESVYTVNGGKVIYAGYMDGRDGEYSANKSYHGIFRWKLTGGVSLEGGIIYFALSKGKLMRKEVMDYSDTRIGNTYKRNETIKNKTLYNIYKNGVKYLSFSWWSDIQSSGWNSFFKKYGY